LVISFKKCKIRTAYQSREVFFLDNHGCNGADCPSTQNYFVGINRTQNANSDSNCATVGCPLAKSYAIRNALGTVHRISIFFSCIYNGMEKFGGRQVGLIGFAFNIVACFLFSVNRNKL